MFDAFLQGFALLLRVDTYVYIAIGLTIGMFVGAMPGLTTTLAVAVLLPISFKLDPMVGIPFLIGVTKGGIYGGSISAILVGIPGTGASIATTFDGPALTRQGKGRKALEMALYASVTGDLISDVITLCLIGPIALLTLLIGPPEIFAIIIFSLVLISSVSPCRYRNRGSPTAGHARRCRDHNRDTGNAASSPDGDSRESRNRRLCRYTSRFP